MQHRLIMTGNNMEPSIVEAETMEKVYELASYQEKGYIKEGYTHWEYSVHPEPKIVTDMQIVQSRPHSNNFHAESY